MLRGDSHPAACFLPGRANTRMLKTRAREDVAGLDLGDGLMVVTRLTTSRSGQLELSHAGWAEYDPDASPQVIANSLRRLWATAGMPTSTVCVRVRSPALVLRYFRLTNLAEHEWASALWLKAEEALQMSRGDIAADWHLNRRPRAGQRAGAGDVVEGLLVAAPRVDVDRTLDMLLLAGLYPVIVDVGCLAACNLVVALSPETVAAEPVCVVNLSRYAADIVVLFREGAVYPHTVSRRVSSWDESVPYLCENILDVLKYQEFKLHEDPVRRVLLTGRMPESDPSGVRIAEAIGVPVEKWDPLKHVSVRRRRLARVLDRELDLGPLLATSMGLALRRDSDAAL